MPDARPDIDLLDGRFYAGDCHPAYAWMRANEPVYRDERNGIWGAASYRAVLDAERDPKTFSNAGGIRPDSPPLPMMIEMDDPAHKKRRMLVYRGFTPKRVAESEPKVRALCDDLIDAVCEQGECDFVRDLAAPLPMIVIGDMIGVAPEDRDDLLRWSDDMVSALSTDASAELQNKAAVAAFEYAEYALKVIAARRVELNAMFERLLVRLPDMKLGTDDPLPRRPANFISGLESMPVQFTPTAPVGARSA